MRTIPGREAGVCGSGWWGQGGDSGFRDALGSRAALGSR